MNISGSNKSNRVFKKPHTFLWSYIMKYKVKPGDSLFKIAQHHYGDGKYWPEIYEKNKGVIGGNSDLIHPGQVLFLPDHI